MRDREIERKSSTDSSISAGIPSKTRARHKPAEKEDSSSVGAIRNRMGHAAGYLFGCSTPSRNTCDWPILISSFMIHLIANGFVYSFGITMNRLSEVFDGQRGLFSFIPSLLAGIFIAVGPLANMMVTKCGFRSVAIAGAVVSSLGVGISAAATNIALLYFTIGIIAGLGFGLMYWTAYFVVAMYFERRRALATCFVASGWGIGILIMAPVNHFLILAFDWKYTLLIMAFVNLTCVLFGASFKTLSKSCSAESVKESSCRFIRSSSSFCRKHMENPPEIRINGELMKDHDIEPPSQIETFFVRQKYIIQTSPTSPQRSLNGSQVNGLNQQGTFGMNKFQTIFLSSGVILRKDIFFCGNLKNMSENKSNSDCHPMQVVTSLGTTSLLYGCATSSKSRGIIDWSIMKNPVFLTLTCLNFLSHLGFIIPFTFTMDRAISLGIDDKSACFLLSIVGFSNTLGRVALGAISEQKWVNNIILYTITLLICGLGVILSNFCESYTLQAIFCIVFGVTSSSNFFMTSIILNDFVGLENLTNGSGILFLFQGLATTISPPIVGAIFDACGSFETGFYLSGTIIFISGLLLMTLPWIKRLKLLNDDEKFSKISSFDKPHLTKSEV